MAVSVEARTAFECLLSEGEVGEFLGVSRRAVRSLRRRKEIAFVRIGRAVRFRQADVREFLEKRVVEARR